MNKEKIIEYKRCDVDPRNDPSSSQQPLHYCYSIQHPVEGKGKFAKQIGGRGNFAEIHIRLEAASQMPGEVRFDHKLAIPSEYFPEISAMLNRCRNHWVDLAAPATLMDIVVTGGIHFEVDASSFAYRQAAILAWQDAIARACRLNLLVVHQLDIDEKEAHID